MKPSPFLRRFLAIAGSALLAAPFANATTLYWDIDGAIAGSGGATPIGTWSTGGTTWSTDSTGATATSAVTTTAFDDLFFSAAADATGGYAVGLNSTTQNARLVTFEDGTATLSAGTGTLSLGTGGGITVTTGTVTGATISSGLTISGGQTFNVGAGRTLTLDTGTFTRNAGATLNVLSTGTVTSTMTNLATGSMVNGIVGPWASFGSGASTKYATFSTNTIVGLTGTAAATAANVTSTLGTFNYDVVGVGALGAGANINTLRYTGATGTISGGLTTKGIMNVGGGTLTLSGTVSGGGELVVNTANGGVSFTSVLTSGTTSLVKDGPGRLQTHNAATTFTGKVTVNGGVLQYGDNISQLTTGNITLNGGVIEQRWTENVVKTQGSGAGQIQILGGDSGFAANGGSGGAVSWDIGAVTWGSATFNPSKFVLQTSASQTNSTIDFKSAINLNGANRTIVANIGASNSTSTLSGIISNSTGTAGLIKEGAGLLILSNANTYNGNTTISAGTLRIGNNTAGTLGSGNYAGNILNNGTLQIWSTSAQTLSGVISGSGGINKAYGGTLTLSGLNTYTGQSVFKPQTTAGFTANVSSFDYITTGTYANHGLGSSLGAPTTVANGTIDVGSLTAQTGTILNYTGSGETTDRVLNFAGNGASTSSITTSGGGLLKFTSDIAVTPLVKIGLGGTGNGEISGNIGVTSGALTKSGAGTWTLSGTNGITGATTISAGTLSLTSATALQNSPFDTASVLGGAAAGLKVATTTLTLGGITGSNAFSGRFTTTAGGYTGLTALTLNPTTGASHSYASDIGNGNGSMALNKTGVGTQTFTAAQTYTGATSITAGTLAISSTGSLNNTAITVSNSGSIFSVATTAAGSVNLGTTTAGTAGATLNLNGSGTVFTMVDTFIGTTNLQQQASFSGTALTLNNATLNFEMSGATADKLAVTGAAATASLTGTNTINLTPRAALTSGTYNLITTAAAAGGLDTGGTFALASGVTTGVASFGGTNYQVTLNNAANAQSVTVAAAPSAMTWTGQALGNGATDANWTTGANTGWALGATPVGFANGNAVTFQDTNTVTAGNVAAPSLAVVVQAGGITTGSTTFNNSAVNYTVSGGAIGGTGGLTKSGTGTVILTGANTYTGATVINGGRLQLGNGGASGTLSTSSTITVTGSGNLAFNNNAVDFAFTQGTQFANKITGTGSVTLVAGNLAMNTATTNDYSGGFTLLGGRVFVGSNAAAIGTGTLTLAGGTFSTSFTGSAGQTLTTTNANIWSGNFGLDGRVTSMTWNNNGTVLLSGGNLTITGATSPTLNLGNVISDGGNNYGLTFTTMTAVTLSGANTYGGGTTMNSGILRINNGGSGGTSSAIGTGALNLGGATVDNNTGGGITLSTNNVFNFTANTTFTGNSLSNGTGNFTINGTRTITVSSPTLTLGGNQTTVGANGIVKAGTGTLRLLGSGVQTGAATISAGTLEVGVINNAGTAGGSSLGNVTTAAANLLMANGTTLRYVGSTNATTDRAFTINGTALGHGVTIESSGAGTLSFSGATALAYGTTAQTRTLTLGGINTGANTFGKVIANNTGATNATSLVKAGVGTWILNQANTYTGTTTISAGTLLIGAAAPSGLAGALGNATSNVSLGGALSASLLTNGAFTVARNIDVAAGAGTTIIGGNSANTSSFTGNITLSKAATLQAFTGGTVDFSTGTWATSNFGLTIGTSGNTGTVKISNPIDTSGGINVNFGTLELNSNFTSGDLAVASGATLIGTGSVGGNATLTGTGIINKSSGTIAGTLNVTGGNWNGVGNVTGLVTSSGTFTIGSSANLTATTGVTTTGGALVINGTLTGALNANSSTTISGTGTVAGNTTIQGTHNPGNSPGIQTFGGDLTYSGVAPVVNWDLTDNTSTNAPNPGAIFDQVMVGGDLDFTNLTALNLIFNGSGSVLWADSFWSNDQSWTLYAVTGTTTNIGNLSLTIANWADSGGNLFDTVLPSGSFNVSQNGNNVMINYVVPEPGAALIGSLGLLALLRRRRN